MRIKEVKNEILGEKYYELNHESGLKIYVFPKENYSTSYAIFGTKYGSVNTMFRNRGDIYLVRQNLLPFPMFR